MVIQPAQGLSLELGFTACLRINLEYFALNTILNSDNFGLSLTGYTYHSALVQAMKTSHEVNLPEYTNFSSWYSLCIVVDNPIRSMGVKFNDYNWNISVERDALPTNVSNIGPKLQVGIFTGRVTDVNMWNWPLTGEQLNEFRHACNNNNSLVKRLVPNLINWQNLTILSLGPAANRTTIRDSDICKNLWSFYCLVELSPEANRS